MADKLGDLAGDGKLAHPRAMRVSCLMVTLPAPARRARQRTAIEAWLRQSHADRELIVVVDHGPAAERADVAAMVAGFGRNDIRLFAPDAPMTLGALRNYSMAQARGDLLCQWDDDDLHHPGRIAAQQAALARSGCPATILGEVLLFREATGALYATRWARTPAGGHPATLLCTRAAGIAYPETGPAARRGEDLAALLPLRQDGRLHCQEGAPHLYTYVGHGGNISGEAHLAMLVGTLAISSGLLRRHAAGLRAHLAAVRFPRAPTLTGADGMVVD